MLFRSVLCVCVFLRSVALCVELSRAAGSYQLLLQTPNSPQHPCHQQQRWLVTVTHTQTQSLIHTHKHPQNTHIQYVCTDTTPSQLPTNTHTHKCAHRHKPPFLSLSFPPKPCSLPFCLELKPTVYLQPFLSPQRDLGPERGY